MDTSIQGDELIELRTGAKPVDVNEGRARESEFVINNISADNVNSVSKNFNLQELESSAPKISIGSEINGKQKNLFDMKSNQFEEVEDIYPTGLEKDKESGMLSTHTGKHISYTSESQSQLHFNDSIGGSSNKRSIIPREELDRRLEYFAHIWLLHRKEINPIDMIHKDTDDVIRSYEVDPNKVVTDYHRLRRSVHEGEISYWHKQKFAEYIVSREVLSTYEADSDQDYLIDSEDINREIDVLIESFIMGLPE